MPYQAPKVGFIGKWAPKIFRFTGTKVHRHKTPKSPFQLEAEAQFISERSIIPRGFIYNFKLDDVKGLCPARFPGSASFFVQHLSGYLYS
jgi:hypothetical protein